jgi:hypothetical protein
LSNPKASSPCPWRPQSERQRSTAARFSILYFSAIVICRNLNDLSGHRSARKGRDSPSMPTTAGQCAARRFGQLRRKSKLHGVVPSPSCRQYQG